MKKILYLFLALLLPGLIFVFLKYSGKNEFNVPVMHEAGVDAPAECGIRYGAPYTVSDTLRNRLKMSQEVNVLVFPADNIDFKKLSSALEDEFGPGRVVVINADDVSDGLAQKEYLRKCVFLVNDPLQATLLDKQGKIRGYYNLSKLDDVDKLRVELKILLKQY